jgi:hypothetical protein
MNHDDFNFDASEYASSIDTGKLTDLWAKIEIAKILTDRANKLTRQIHADLEFYKMTSNFKSDSDD